MEVEIFVIFTLAMDIFVIPLFVLHVHIGDNVTFKCGGMRVSLFSKDCPQSFNLSFCQIIFDKKKSFCQFWDWFGLETIGFD